MNHGATGRRDNGGMIIRDAVDADLDAILAIHNAAIRDSTAIWTDVEVDRADREAWLAEHRRDGYPVIVAELDGVTVGYASTGRWREKIGYRHTVENSVYVGSGHHGRGIGRALLTELIERSRAAGIHVIVAAIEAENSVSIRLHESLGFVSAGVVPEVGTKFGRWLDLALLTLTLPRDPAS